MLVGCIFQNHLNCLYSSTDSMEVPEEVLKCPMGPCLLVLVTVSITSQDKMVLPPRC